MAVERTGVCTARGNPLTLVGAEMTVGQKAPNFTVLGQGMAPISLSDSAGKVRIIVTVPSLDTPVCSEETIKFNGLAASLPDNTEILTLSMDLPFAQARWCGANGVESLTTASDFKEREFQETYGVKIKENGLLTRAVFVVGKDDTVKHAQYVSEITDFPDFDAAIAAAKAAASE